jgi:hypothetical protein
LIALPRLVDGGSEEADLNLRGSLNGVATSPQATRRFFRARQRRILLIHGCNTSQAHGQKAMAPLQDVLSERCDTVQDQILTITWPGDIDWFHGGIAAYSAMVPKAVSAGKKLWQYLQAEYEDGMGAAELVIVAQSLGCRLTLEMIAALAGSGRPAGLTKLVLVLMAAAVPSDMDALISCAKSYADEVVVLHSEHDRALKKWFRLGQSFTGEGLLPEAVGFRGNPLTPPWSFERRMRGYDHIGAGRQRPTYWQRGCKNISQTFSFVVALTARIDWK